MNQACSVAEPAVGKETFATLSPGLPITFCGRTFFKNEISVMRQIAADCAALGITEIARTICELLNWRRPNGGLKNHECRQLLERLRDCGWLSLPELQNRGPCGPREVRLSANSNPQSAVIGTVAQYAPLQLTLVEAASTESRLWIELVERYHYLRYRVSVGAQLRYLVQSNQGQVLACLLWTSSAWKMAVRDHWIGWDTEQRVRNLPLVVNNSRFLILPWVRVAGLASKILAQCAARLQQDWPQRYGCQPALLESLVDSTRFNGTCYRAANWVFLGLTQGRGRMDRHHQAKRLAPKLIFVYPLHRNFRERLCRSPS